MAKTLTIADLARMAEHQVRMGNGDKKILISTDDEGNGFHELFYAFSNAEEMFSGKYPPNLPCNVRKEDLKNYIILG